MDRPLVKIPRTMMRSWAARHLKVEQGGECPMCRDSIDLTIKAEGVIDHDHVTGEVRGVLHRSCNAAEGKIFNAAARWGCKSSKREDVVQYLRNMVVYLEQAGTGRMYPMHKTTDEKTSLRNARARQRRAEVKAKLLMRSRKETT